MTRFMIVVAFAQMPHISSTQAQKPPDIPIWLAILMLTMAVLYIVVRIKDYTESACAPNLQDRHGLRLIARDRIPVDECHIPEHANSQCLNRI
jgi:hypothetical protein